MHILEDEEEEGEEVFALPSGGGDTGAPSITALKNGGGGVGGVLNGDLPETPPSDMDEEMKEEEEEEEMEVVGRENGDSILATNGKSSTALTPPPKVKPSENGNSDETSCDKIEDNEDVEMGEEKEKLNGREQRVNETDKAIPASNPTEKKPSDTGTEAMARPVAKTRRNSNDESSGDKLEETETQIAKDTKNEAKEIDNETSNKQDTDHKNDAAEDCVDKDGLNDELKLNTDGEKTNVDDKSDKKEELHGTTKEDDCAKETRSEDKAIAEGISSEVDSESKANECTPDTEETTEKQDEDAAERSDKLTKSGVKEEESQQDDDDGDRQIDKDTDTVVKKKTRKSSVDSKSCTETIRNDMEYGESLQNETEDNSVSKELAVTENQSGERDEDLTSPSTAELNELMLANNMEITICKTSTPPPTGEKSNNLVNTTESSLSGDLKRRRSSTSSNHSNHSSGSNSSNKHHHHPSSKQQCTSSTVSVPSRPNSRSGNSATPPSGETSRNSTSERNSANGLSTPLQIELSRTDSGASENDRDSASEAESLVLEAASKAAASLEAELMLAKCTDGEVTITKSGTSTPALAPVVMGGSEQRSSVSDLRMMRRSDLKRTLSSDVRTSSGNNNNNNNSSNHNVTLDTTRC
uniref:Uncharacterized protein n=1 Tax=Cacopsylla melanoneura TaxID=428564 RepID=A0A8D8UIX8_9HEMI